MQKIKQIALLSSIFISTLSVAAPTEPFTTTVGNVKAALGNQTADATVKKGLTTVTSPRTGISYTLGNTEGRSIVFQTDAIAPANETNVKRIVATNPALSAESQQKAEKALLDMPSTPN